MSEGKSIASTLYKYFGAREGEGLKDFVGELKFLSDEEKAMLAQGIVDETFDYPNV